VENSNSRVRFLVIRSEDEALGALKGVEADARAIQETLPRMTQVTIIDRKSVV